MGLMHGGGLYIHRHPIGNAPNLKDTIHWFLMTFYSLWKTFSNVYFAVRFENDWSTTEFKVTVQNLLIHIRSLNMFQVDVIWRKKLNVAEA